MVLMEAIAEGRVNSLRVIFPDQRHPGRPLVNPTTQSPF
jgi:hypothetical protein